MAAPQSTKAEVLPLRKRNYRDADGAIVNEILNEEPFDAGQALAAEARRSGLAEEPAFIDGGKLMPNTAKSAW